MHIQGTAGIKLSRMLDLRQDGGDMVGKVRHGKHFGVGLLALAPERPWQCT